MPSALSLYQALLSELRSQVLLQKFRQPCRCALRRRITSLLELETVRLANIGRPAAIEADLSLSLGCPGDPWPKCLPANLPVFGEAHSMTVALGNPLKTSEGSVAILAFVIAVNCRNVEPSRPTTLREGPTISEKPSGPGDY